MHGCRALAQRLPRGATRSRSSPTRSRKRPSMPARAASRARRVRWRRQGATCHPRVRRSCARRDRPRRTPRATTGRARTCERRRRWRRSPPGRRQDHVTDKERACGERVDDGAERTLERRGERLGGTMSRGRQPLASAIMRKASESRHDNIDGDEWREHQVQDPFPVMVSQPSSCRKRVVV